MEAQFFSTSEHNSSLLRRSVNMGWASAYDRSSFLSPLLSVTKFNMHKPLTNTEANKMHLYWFLQNKGIIIIAWRSMSAKLCSYVPVKLISEAVQSNKYGKWKCNSIHGILYSLSIVTFILCARLVFLWRLSCLKAFCFPNKDLMMVLRVLYVFISPSTNNLPLLSYSYCTHFNIKPNLLQTPSFLSEWWYGEWSPRLVCNL